MLHTYMCLCILNWVFMCILLILGVCIKFLKVYNYQLWKLLCSDLSDV